MKFPAVVAATALTAAALGMTACDSSSTSGSSNENGLTNLSVGYTSEGGLQIPSYVAQDLGIFKKNGLNVKLVNLNSSTSLIPALTGHSVDIGTGDGAALCAGYLTGSTIDVVGANLSKFTLEGWGTDSIKSIHDLAGKTVGVTAPGSTSDFALAAALEANGMSRNDVKVVYLRSISATIAAATRGAIQATFVVPPWGNTLDPSKFHRFYDTSSIDHVSTGFAVDDAFAKSHPNAVKQYLTAMKEAVTFSADKVNESKVTPVISKDTSVSSANAGYAFEYFRPLWKKSLTINPAAWANSCHEATQTTMPKAGIDPQQALDVSFLPKEGQ